MQVPVHIHVRGDGGRGSSGREVRRFSPLRGRRERAAAAAARAHARRRRLSGLAFGAGLLAAGAAGRLALRHRARAEA
jgi:hypothetical protein